MTLNRNEKEKTLEELMDNSENICILHEALQNLAAQGPH